MTSKRLWQLWVCDQVVGMLICSHSHRVYRGSLHTKLNESVDANFQHLMNVDTFRCVPRKFRGLIPSPALVIIVSFNMNEQNVRIVVDWPVGGRVLLGQSLAHNFDDCVLNYGGKNRWKRRHGNCFLVLLVGFFCLLFPGPFKLHHGVHLDGAVGLLGPIFGFNRTVTWREKQAVILYFISFFNWFSNLILFTIWTTWTTRKPNVNTQRYLLWCFRGIFCWASSSVTGATRFLLCWRRKTVQ